MNKTIKLKNKNNIFQIAFNTPRGNILTPLLLCVLYFSACFIYNIFNIQLTGIFKPCYFKMLTGYNCPGCGTTRAIQELLNLNIYEAFRYNPVIGSIALILLILIVAMFINAIKRPYTPFRIKLKIWQIVIISLIPFIFLFLRVLPPFNIFFY